MQHDRTEDNCRCGECKVIHEEFIEQFGRWPHMTHNDGQELKARRKDNLQSWDMAMALGMTKEEVEDQAVHQMEERSGERHT